MYFLLEAHAEYKELGLPDFGPAYFTSRGACMGQVPGEVVTAAFGVFNPAIVIPAVDEGWANTDRDSILGARERGAVDGLTRLLGPSPDGMKRATEILDPRRRRRDRRGTGPLLGSALARLPRHADGRLLASQ